MYTMLTGYSPYSSQNAGDASIEQRAGSRVLQMRRRFRFRRPEP